MARREKVNPNTKKCIVCNRKYTLDKFVKGYDSDGLCFVCTDCRKKIAKDLNGLKEYCEISNRGFSSSLWNDVMDMIEEKYRNDTKKMEDKEKYKLIESKAISLYFSKMNLSNYIPDSLDDNSTEEISSNEIQYENLDELISKWGKGFKPEEYYEFEQKFQRMALKYNLVTEGHIDSLRLSIIYYTKAINATANGQSKEAKEWMDMYTKAMEQGKLKPSQMSKADLSGGMDTFGQLSRMVEETVDIIPILPKFKEKPKDKPDFNIWCWANYVRHLMDMPLCDYKDIYNFYEERKKDFENSGSHLLDEEGDF